MPSAVKHLLGSFVFVECLGLYLNSFVNLIIIASILDFMGGTMLSRLANPIRRLLIVTDFKTSQVDYWGGVRSLLFIGPFV